MKVNASLEEISDGRLYDINDMVKIDTHGCKGCSHCCHGVGDTIVLNPFDMYQMIIYSGKSYNDLIGTKIELHVEEKVALPNLKMVGENDGCGFLDANGRCSIHEARPSICRLFPLGRYYDDGDFKYFFKVGECIEPQLSKIKVKKWINIVNYNENKQFILDWYELLKALRWRLKFVRDEEALQEINDYFVETFYNCQWTEGEDFYQSFYDRLPKAKDDLGII